ncbi:MAG: hypothetical protein F6K22_06690 [Okeania sp. SIO2F4]|uniref:hypothetical protein n=1 Tax=Okeania sp. SIO2F4 TaxID=2607790 RepID=UPI00142D127B|nr:hypothetical protein [Okeania sp. SIO2F4]NES02556.1 hypothetical protein [Okeania sp. SIO2F4]
MPIKSILCFSQKFAIIHKAVSLAVSSSLVSRVRYCGAIARPERCLVSQTGAMFR